MRISRILLLAPLRLSHARRISLLSIVLCFLAGGCSGFKPIDYNQVKLGVTTRQEIVATLGEPDNVGVFIMQVVTPVGGLTPPGSFDVAQNRISSSVLDPKTTSGNGEKDMYQSAGFNTARIMYVYYYDKILVGYHYFPPGVGNPGPEESKIARIEKGKTSVAELLTLLGPPDSASLVPTFPTAKAKSLTWGLIPMLMVSLDENDIVSDVREIRPGASP